MFGVALGLYALLGYVLAHLLVEAPSDAAAQDG
jgi:hypothetical protein